MSKQSIKATIDANIKQNGVQAITGEVMNSVLNQMVDNLAEEASTTEKLTELESEVDGILGEMTSKEVLSIAGENALLFDFVKGEKYKIKVKLSAKVADFGLYINDANGSTIHNFGVKHNTDEWVEEDFIPTADADKLMVFISSADVQINAELTQLKERDFSALSNIPTIFEFEKRIEKELVVGDNWNSARFEEGKTYSILVDTTISLDTLGLYTINDSNEVLDNLGVFSGSHIEAEFTATKDAQYLVIYASASVSCSCTISEVSKKFNDELNHDIALATAFDRSKLSRKCGLVAFIFDDSLPYNDVALGNSCKWIYDEFTKRGLKFTIALSTIAEPIDLAKYRRYVDEGHGILSHSIDHLDYVANSIEQVKADCVKTLDWLNNGGLPCRGFVYPNNSRNEEIQQLMRQYYGYAFGMQIKDTHITPNDDLYSLSRFGDVALKTFEQVKAAIDECIESKGLLILWAHGYWIGTAGHTSQDEVIRMLDYLAEKKYSYEIEQTTVDKAMDMYF